MRMRSRDHLHLSHQVVLCITSVHSSKLYVLLMLTSVNICEHHLLTSANICEHHLWTSVNTFVCNQSLSNQRFYFIYNPLTIFCFCLASYLKVNGKRKQEKQKGTVKKKPLCSFPGGCTTTARGATGICSKEDHGAKTRNCKHCEFEGCATRVERLSDQFCEKYIWSIYDHSSLNYTW